MKMCLKGKKVLLLCLALALTALLAFGCQGGDAPPADQPSDNNQEQQGDNQDTPTYSGEILVSAAASLREPLGEAAELFQTSQPDLTINFNFGASGALLQQLENGAPSDLFISAATKQMDQAQEKNLIFNDSRFDWLLNNLVIAVPADSALEINSMEDVLQAKSIAIGAPDSVPAGTYAKEALTNAGIWDQVEPLAVLAKDVSQVTAFVESGSAELGFIYLSDLYGRDKVKVAMEVPADLYSAVTYPAAVLQSSQQQDAAKAFLAFLQTPDVTTIMEKYGFSVISE